MESDPLDWICNLFPFIICTSKPQSSETGASALTYDAAPDLFTFVTLELGHSSPILRRRYTNRNVLIINELELKIKKIK